LIASGLLAPLVLLSFSLTGQKLAKQPRTIFRQIGSFWASRRVSTQIPVGSGNSSRALC